MAGSETASVRVASRCHTSDRGPSRKFHERARLRLASSQNQRVNDEFVANKQGDKNDKIGVQNTTQQNFSSPYQPMGIKQISSREGSGYPVHAAVVQSQHQQQNNTYRKGCSTSQQPRRNAPFEPILEQSSSPYEKDMNVFHHKNSSK
jgi:hypothetical protein